MRLVTSEVNARQLVAAVSSLCSSLQKHEDSDAVAHRLVQALEGVQLADFIHVQLGNQSAGVSWVEVELPQRESSSAGDWLDYPQSTDGPRAVWTLAPGSATRLSLGWKSPVSLQQKLDLEEICDFLKLCLNHLARESERSPLGVDLFALAGLIAKANDVRELLDTVLQTLVRLSGAVGGRVELVGGTQRCSESGQTQGTRALFCPVLCHDQVRAMVQLNFDCRTAPTGQQISILQSFSSQIGLALENALNHEREREEAREAVPVYYWPGNRPVSPTRPKPVKPAPKAPAPPAR